MLPGLYSVTWLLQLFDPSCYPSGDLCTENHFDFPTRGETIRHPGGPLGMCMTVGCPKITNAPSATVNEMAKDGYLLVPHLIESDGDDEQTFMAVVQYRLWKEMKNHGWLALGSNTSGLENSGFLKVSEKQDLLFLMEYATGHWWGGFRFGGVCLRRVD